jgi:hypothetical protein
MATLFRALSVHLYAISCTRPVFLIVILEKPRPYAPHESNVQSTSLQDVRAQWILGAGPQRMAFSAQSAAVSEELSKSQSHH